MVLKLPVKTERGGRVFPASDKSSDVIKALTTALKKYKVNIMLNTAVKDILIESGRVTGVSTDSGIYNSDAVIIATGGLAYPQTGSTGDGYAFAKKAGHTVTKTYPALVPFNVKEDWPKELMGFLCEMFRLHLKKIIKFSTAISEKCFLLILALADLLYLQPAVILPII